MIITTPSLKLRFISENSTVTVSSSYLVLHSFEFKEQLLKELKSSSNSVSFQLSEDCPAIESILQAAGDITAQLKDGDTVLFTGYLSDSYKWVVTDSGTKAFSVTIEDVGTKLLGKTFLNNSSASTYVFDEYVNSTSGHSVVREVCTAAGITVDANAPLITERVVKLINRDTTCREILDEMLFEVGYAYYFTKEGKLSLYEINCDSTSGLQTLNSDDLYCIDKNAITLTKKIKQYKQVNVEWNSLEYRNNVLVYQDISGQSLEYPHCNITIPSGASYPDADGNVAKTEACDLEKGNVIVYISNVVPDISVVSGTYTSSITQSGSNAIGVLVSNTGNNDVIVRKLQASANICSIKANNITVAGETVTSEESNNLYNYTAKYIHSQNSAKKLANLIVDYYKFCNYTYSFNSKENLSTGTLVNIVDDTFSGLNTNVLIIGRSFTDSSDIIKYTAVAISAFDLSETVFNDSTAPAPSVIPGPPGNSVVSISYYYAATSTQTQPLPETITSPTIPVLDPVTNKYLWQKEVILYSNTETSVNVSLLSIYGDSSYIFRLKSSPSNIIQNRRLTSSQTLTLSTEISGYSGTPTISYYYSDEDPDTKISVTANTVVFSLPYNNSHPSLIAEATLSGAPSQTLEISAIDETEKFRYLGEFNIDTSDYYGSDGSFIPENYNLIDWSDINDELETNETFLSGDSFFNNYSESGFTDVYIYVYEQGKWIPIHYSTLTNGDKSIICSQAMSDVLSTIETGSVTKSDFGYFNTIITETVTADYIGGKEIEVQSGGFVYGGDVDITQPAGQRLGSSGAGFCFDSQGNAEMSNIRISGNSTIEGGSTVLGTLINYDSNQKPVFKTVKESTANVSIAGSKTDGTSAPAAYLWNSFYQWLKNAIISNATSGTYYSATSSTIYGTWSAGSITSQSVIGIKYWSSVPTTTNTNQVNGDRGAGTSETKEMYRNPNSYYMTFSQITCHPKTKSSIWGETGYGELKCTSYYSNGTAYQTLCNAGETSGTGGAGMIYLYNVKVPPGGYIIAEAGTYSGFPWGSWDTDLYLTFNYKESDMFSSGINFVTSNGQIYAYDNVIPSASSYSTYSQTLTCSGLSLSLALSMTPSSSWPVEKYYRFSYSTAPSTTAAVTSSIFQSQSFSYRGVSKTVSSITYSQSYLKVIATDGYVYEFQTASGNYYPRHTFSFVTNGESLGAYARSMLPTDDPNTHNIGASSSYDSGVSQRWNNGFFTTVDASDGIYANTINGNLVFQSFSTSGSIGNIPVNSMKLVRATSSGITISFTGTCLVVSLISGATPGVTTASSSYTTSSAGAFFFIRVS